MDVLNISVTNTSIALAFTSVLLLCYLLHRSKTSKAISPPEAGGAWPILGHLHLLGGPQLPHKTLASMSDKYGPIFTIRLGLHRAVVVSNWEIAKECFTTHDIAYLGLFLVSDALPFLRWLDLGGHEKAMKETAKEMDCLVGGWLEEHRRKRDSGESNGEQDFMEVMLSTLEDTDLAGYDKAHEELDFYIGKERQVDESDIGKLVYLQAIVKETLRLYPAGPLSGPREFTEDCIIGGYHVSKGTRLTLNLWKLQRDPTIWREPLEFRPERFVTSHKDVDVKGQHFELIPFGAGRRVCPGTLFSIQMLHLVLARDDFYSI
ncbi:hypothetical protein ACSBR1_000423 [Camellia fascicularis]